MRLPTTLFLFLVLGNVADASADSIQPLVVISVFDIDLDNARQTEPLATQGPSLSQELVNLLEYGGHTVHDRAIESRYPDRPYTELSVTEGTSVTAPDRSCQALHDRLDVMFANTMFGIGALFAYEDLDQRSMRLIASPNMCCEVSRVVGQPSGIIYKQQILFMADWTNKATKDLARLCAAKAVAAW